MSETLWSARADDLLGQTASAAPTPGGGSIAAVVGAFGVGLLQMAVAVTADGDGALRSYESPLKRVQTRIVGAADDDVRDFDAVMSAYRLPNDDEIHREVRARALEAASIAATEGPLALVRDLVEALVLSNELEPLVKKSIVSDVLAGRDIVAGAARAAIRTADINLGQLDRLASPAASELHERVNALASAVEAAS